MIGASRFPPICADKAHVDDSRHLSLLSTPLGQPKSILAVTSAVGRHWTASIWCPAAGRPLPGQASSQGGARRLVHNSTQPGPWRLLRFCPPEIGVLVAKQKHDSGRKKMDQRRSKEKTEPGGRQGAHAALGKGRGRRGKG
jgi:hypothetical protein